MADRSFYTPQSSVLQCVFLPVTLLGQGTGNAPILNNGDPNATWFQQPVRTGSGVYTLTTADGYPSTAPCALSLNLVQAVPTASSDVVEGPLPTQNASNQFTFTINVFPSGTSGDLGVGDAVRVLLVMQNSGLQV